jgi:hypothetical protein
VNCTIAAGQNQRQGRGERLKGEGREKSRGTRNDRPFGTGTGDEGKGRKEEAERCTLLLWLTTTAYCIINLWYVVRLPHGTQVPSPFYHDPGRFSSASGKWNGRRRPAHVPNLRRPGTRGRMLLRRRRKERRMLRTDVKMWAADASPPSCLRVEHRKLGLSRQPYADNAIPSCL